jgi:hypothetical protein
VAELLGDLGVVLLSPLISPLLDEIEHRVLSVENILTGQLMSDMHASTVSTYRGPRGWFAKPQARPMNPAVVESGAKLQKIRPAMLSDLADLRRLCLYTYDNTGDVLLKAQRAMCNFARRLTSGSTSQFSDRFRKLPGLLRDNNICRIVEFDYDDQEEALPITDHSFAAHLSECTVQRSQRIKDHKEYKRPRIESLGESDDDIEFEARFISAPHSSSDTYAAAAARLRALREGRHPVTGMILGAGAVKAQAAAASGL